MIEILHKLVWPVTIVLGFLLFRNSLFELVSRTRHPQIEDERHDVEFDDMIGRIGAEAERALPESITTPEKDVPAHLYELAELSPPSAIAEAWQSIESSAKQLIRSRDIDVDDNVSIPDKLIQIVLVRGNVIDERSGRIYQELNQLRNEVVHAADFDLSADQAKEYVAISWKLRGYFGQLAL